MPRPPKQIPRDSEFAKYRDLPRVGPQFVENDDLFDSDPVVSEDLFDGLPKESPLYRHFGFHQNDAIVIAGWHRGDEVGLVLNHYDVWRLASCAELVGWRESRTYFPVTVLFKGVKEFHALRTAEHRVWQLIRNRRRRIFNNLSDVSYMKVVRFEEDNVVIELEINEGRGFRRGKKRLSEWSTGGYKVCIVATSIEIVEQHREGWIEHCGADTLPLLDQFESVWPVPGWSVPDFEKWIQEHM